MRAARLPPANRGYGSFDDFYDSFRLFELWFEQELAIPHFGKLSLRLGQLASDKEFYGTEVGALFINSSFGSRCAKSENTAAIGAERSPDLPTTRTVAVSFRSTRS